MLEFFDSSAKLVGHSGSILLPDDDEITRKLAMLFEGQCEGLGPTQAARKFGYTKQRYFQLLEQFEAQGALALQSKARGPKTNYRRTEEMVRQIIRHRFLDPDASAEVIAQKEVLQRFDSSEKSRFCSKTVFPKCHKINDRLFCKIVKARSF
jgi:hypothetical protein